MKMSKESTISGSDISAFAFSRGQAGRTGFRCIKEEYTQMDKLSGFVRYYVARSYE